MRHYAALQSAHQALESALMALDNVLPSDLISEDIRQVLHHLGEITGEVTSDDILQTIFSKFCIGK
jgi:tRNA modification GTPase